MDKDAIRAEIETLDKYQERYRNIATKRLLLIKKLESYLESQKLSHGNSYRKTLSIQKFCSGHNISWQTFYQHLRIYKQFGLEGLIPGWGWRAGKSCLDDVIYEITRKVFDPSVDRVTIYGEIENICKKKGIKTPCKSTMRRFLKAHNFDEYMRSGKIDKTGHHKPDQIRISPSDDKSIRRKTFPCKIDIEFRNPLRCFRQLRTAIVEQDGINEDVQRGTLWFLDYCIHLTPDNVSKYRPAMLNRKLTGREIAELKAYINKGEPAADKAKALIMAHEGHTMLQISIAVRRPIQTIYGWYRRFFSEGIQFIETKVDRKKFCPELAKRTSRIIEILHHAPIDFGINRSSWHLAGIAQVYYQLYNKRLSPHTIGKAIKEAKYSWRRARKVLTSPDPEYREKTKKVLDTLRGLGPKDAFFFIDEGGPWHVRKYGGKSFTPKGEVKLIPQYQKSKGKVSIIGALDAVKNQVIHLPIKSKNTKAVIALINVLAYRYCSYKNLYMTWDCASWHKSKELKEALKSLDRRTGLPTITIVSLPKQSQFLNVIEAIFSGMKRAVVDNSDYGSAFEMKIAISRHFKERNQYYRDNPKRAGNKIWDREYYNLEDVGGGVFKHV